MKIALSLAMALFLIPSIGAAGVQGKYTLDKKRLMSELKGELKKLPKNRRSFARVSVGMLRTMQFHFTLARRGKASAFMSMKIFGKLKTKKGTGHWKQTKDKSIRITLKSVDNKGNAMTDKFVCQALKGDRLSCVNANKGKKKKVMIFNKAK